MPLQQIATYLKKKTLHILLCTLNQWPLSSPICVLYKKLAITTEEIGNFLVLQRAVAQENHLVATSSSSLFESISRRYDGSSYMTESIQRAYVYVHVSVDAREARRGHQIP